MMTRVRTFLDILSTFNAVFNVSILNVRNRLIISIESIFSSTVNEHKHSQAT